MKKYFKYYALGWLIALALFNVIVFVTPNEIAGQSKFSGAFWVGYIFITVAFIGQLGCSWFFFREERREKVFLNIPVISISYTALIVTLIVGALCMVIPGLPYWVGIVVCLAVLAFYAVSIIKARAAADAVEEVGQKVHTQTLFIRSLTADAEGLLARAKSDAAKAETKKVYEALRYSDPMSSEALCVVEGQITTKFAAFSAAVEADEAETVKATGEELLILIGDRNRKCRMMK